MRKLTRRFKKTSLIIILSLLILAVLVVVFISPITKYAVEKYSVKYTGRQIKMKWAYVNPFTGYIHFDGFKMYEPKSDSVFFSMSGMSVSFDVWKLFSNQYEITGLTLDDMWLRIVQNQKQSNLSDFMKQFASKDTTDTLPSAVRFKLQNLKITRGEIHYEEQSIPINYFIRDFNLESKGVQSNVDTVDGKFSFLSGPSSGKVSCDFNMNLKTLNYAFGLVINNFDLQVIEQYLKDLTNYGRFTACMDADIKSVGNFHDELDVSTSGSITVNDFHLGKENGADYFSFEKMQYVLAEVNPKNKRYFLDSVILTHPVFVFEQYDYLNNLERMFGKQGANIKAASQDPMRFNLIIELANYIADISKEFFRGDYKIKRVAIYNGDFTYNDYTPREKFSVSTNPLTITADSVDKSHQRAEFIMKTGLEPFGQGAVSVKVNPKDYGDFIMNYHFEKIPIPVFNPYFISYTSFPLDRGVMEVKGDWNVKGGKISSENHLLILDPRVGKRLKKKDTHWLPMPLVMALVREQGNVIDYEIPVTGDLKNPKFHLRDVIFSIIKNIFVKPVTTPYRIHVKQIETELEKAFTLKWELRQTELHPRQEKFVNKIADFLESNPGALLAVYPLQYAVKEKEYILFFEAKKKYFLQTRKDKETPFSEDDSILVDKMSVKDSSFIRYLDKHLRDSMMFTVQEKCRAFVDAAVLNAKFRQLVNARETTFLSYFKKTNTASRVTMHKDENTIPFNGFSYYKIDYKGEFPEKVKKAFEEMNELNEENPRKKYEKERRKNGVLLEDKKHVK